MPLEAVLRDAALDDAAAILTLNNANAPAVSPTDLERMRWYLDECPYFRIVVVDERQAPREPGSPGDRLTERRAGGRGAMTSSDALVDAPPAHSNLAGFLNAMTPDTGYDSGNFRWFRERGDDFVYIDRVAVSETFRGRGIGARLYADVERWARERGAARLTCEVNVRPRNDGSLAFHDRMGFRGIDERETEYGLRVLMMEKVL